MNRVPIALAWRCAQPHAVLMNDQRRQRGIRAEWAAAAYLESRGLRLLARNVGCKAGELDLVCLDVEVLVIVEVRLRSSAGFGGALASITARKRGRLIRAAQFLSQTRPDWRARSIRFDVVAVQGNLNRVDDLRDAHLVWVRDAFRTT